MKRLSCRSKWMGGFAGREVNQMPSACFYIFKAQGAAIAEAEGERNLAEVRKGKSMQ